MKLLIPASQPTNGMAAQRSTDITTAKVPTGDHQAAALHCGCQCSIARLHDRLYITDVKGYATCMCISHAVTCDSFTQNLDCKKNRNVSFMILLGPLYLLLLNMYQLITLRGSRIPQPTRAINMSGAAFLSLLNIHSGSATPMLIPWGPSG